MAPPLDARAPAPYVGTGLIGPNSAFIFDQDNNGPDASDLFVVPRIIPSRTETIVQFPTPWDCNPNNQNDRVRFVDGDGNGSFETFRYRAGIVNTEGYFTKFSNGTPIGGRIYNYILAQDGLNVGMQSTALTPFINNTFFLVGDVRMQVVDGNGDRVYEGFQARGYVAIRRLGQALNIKLSGNFVTLDTNGDSIPDKLSIPWTLVQFLGIRPILRCGPRTIGQPWASLTPEGTVGVDLDADNQQDPGFWESPQLVGPPGPPDPPPPVTGCTLTADYWSTHLNELAPFLTIALGRPGGGPKTLLVYNIAIAQTVFAGDPANGIKRLRRELLAAKANIAAGASFDAVADDINRADTLLAIRNHLDWPQIPASDRAIIAALADRLQQFNEGAIGPGECVATT
jgi:hypothetical protein